MVGALGSSVMVGLHQWLVCNWLVGWHDCAVEIDGWFALMFALRLSAYVSLFLQPEAFEVLKPLYL